MSTSSGIEIKAPIMFCYQDKFWSLARPNRSKLCPVHEQGESLQSVTRAQVYSRHACGAAQGQKNGGNPFYHRVVT